MVTGGRNVEPLYLPSDVPSPLKICQANIHWKYSFIDLICKSHLHRGHESNLKIGEWQLHTAIILRGIITFKRVFHTVIAWIKIRKEWRAHRSSCFRTLKSFRCVRNNFRPSCDFNLISCSNSNTIQQIIVRLILYIYYISINCFMFTHSPKRTPKQMPLLNLHHTCIWLQAFEFYCDIDGFDRMFVDHKYFRRMVARKIAGSPHIRNQLSIRCRWSWSSYNCSWGRYERNTTKVTQCLFTEGLRTSATSEFEQRVYADWLSGLWHNEARNTVLMKTTHSIATCMRHDGQVISSIRHWYLYLSKPLVPFWIAVNFCGIKIAKSKVSLCWLDNESSTLDSCVSRHIDSSFVSIHICGKTKTTRMTLSFCASHCSTYNWIIQNRYKCIY